MRGIKILLLLALLAGVVIAVTTIMDKNAGDGGKANAGDENRPKKEVPRLEERYGFTGEQAGP